MDNANPALKRTLHAYVSVIEWLLEEGRSKPTPNSCATVFFLSLGVLNISLRDQ